MSIDGVGESKLSYNWSVSGEGKSGILKLKIDEKETTFPCTVLTGKESTLSRGLGGLAERVGLVTRIRIPPEGGGKDIRVWNFHLGVFLTKGTQADRHAQLSSALSCNFWNQQLSVQALQFLKEENREENNEIIERAKGYLGEEGIILTKPMHTKLEDLKEGESLSIDLGKKYVLKAEKDNHGNLQVEIQKPSGESIEFFRNDSDIGEFD